MKPFLIVRWLSLGNQLQGVRLVDEGLRARFKAGYPDVDVQPSSPPRAAAAPMEVDRPSRSPFVEGETKSSTLTGPMSVDRDVTN